MLLPLFEALKIQYDPERRFTRFQWLDPYRRVLRPALEHGRQVVEQLRPHHSLIDFTHLPPVSLSDELWLSLQWFPRIVKLPFRQVAIVSRAEHLHNQMVVEAMFWLSRMLIRFQVQLFDDVPSALEWLLGGDQAAALALQQEWDTAPVPKVLPADAAAV